MSKTLLLGFFFVLLLNMLKYSACASTSTAEAGDFRTSKSQKQPKLMYGTVTESSKPGNQRRLPALYVVQHTSTSMKARAIYGGANDMRRPRNGRNGANSISIKRSSLLMTALKYLVYGLLLVLFCF